MIFPAVAIFALVTSFITPILSAPIPVPNSNVELTKSHLSHRVFAKGPSASLGPYHHGMYNILNHDGSMEPIADIHSRPVHIDTVGGAAEPALSRVGEGESPRLVRRKSLGAKIKAAFKVNPHTFQSRYATNKYYRKSVQRSKAPSKSVSSLPIALYN
jgi:hypothetical protein